MTPDTKIATVIDAKGRVGFDIQSRKADHKTVAVTNVTDLEAGEDMIEAGVADDDPKVTRFFIIPKKLVFTKDLNS